MPRSDLVLKTAALAALLLALWNPAWPFGTAGTPVLVLDVSDSMGLAPDDTAWHRIARRVQSVSGAVSLDVVRFAGIAQPKRRMRADRVRPSPPELDTSNTDIEAGLLAAIADSERDQPIFLFTDGIETRGDATRELEFARDRGQGVFLMETTPRPGGTPHSRIVSVRTPPHVRVGSTYPAAVTISAAGDAAASLEVHDREQRIASRAIRLASGTTTQVVELRATRTGAVPLTFTLTGARANDRYDTIVDVEGTAHVLYVSHSDLQSPFAAALQRGGWDVTHWEPANLARGVPIGIGAVVLDNIAASDTSELAWHYLIESVEAGGKGLIVLGGDHSFGTGGYLNSSLESLLPVTAQAGAPRAPLSMMFLLDASGSMDDRLDGANRFSRARETLLRIVPNMDQDEIGVATFDSEARTLLPLARYSAPEESVGEVLRAYAPSGGTVLGNGLHLALAELQHARNRRRVLVIVTDGFAADTGFARDMERVDSLQTDVIALAIGPDADVDLLGRLTRDQHKVLRVAGVAEVPVFMDEVLGTRRDAMRAGETRAVQLHALPFLATIEPWPRLAGYMVTRARPAATVYLASTEREPLIAAWPKGMGLVIAIPGSIDGFANGWLEWRGWGRFAGGLIEWAAGSSNADGIQVSIRSDQAAPQLLVDAVDASGEWSGEGPATLLALIGGSSSPGATPVAIPKVAPGRYSAVLHPTGPGPHRVAITTPDHRLLRQFFPHSRSEWDARRSRIAAWTAAGLLRPASAYRSPASGESRTAFLVLALMLYAFSMHSLIPSKRSPK